MKEQKCECEICKLGLETVHKREQINLKEFGWYAHCVADDPASPTGFNYHTHGLPHSFHHPDIQIVFPMRMQVCHEIATVIIDKIKAGMVFKVDEFYDKILGNGYKIQFIAAKECDRDVLRALIPDKEHQYKGKYALQLMD